MTLLSLQEDGGESESSQNGEDDQHEYGHEKEDIGQEQEKEEKSPALKATTIIPELHDPHVQKKRKTGGQAQTKREKVETRAAIR